MNSFVCGISVSGVCDVDWNTIWNICRILIKGNIQQYIYIQG